MINDIKFLVNSNIDQPGIISTDKKFITKDSNENRYSFYISDPSHSFSKILKRLPSNWNPDVIILKSPEYYLIPYDIDQFNIPIVALLEDWNVTFESIKYNLPRFDYIFTDRKGVNLLKSTGYNNVEYFPFFPYSPEKYRIIKGLERIYDVSFVGSMNHAIQYDRAPLLKKITQLSDKYKIKIFTDVWGLDYTIILNQSKIVFNKTVRSEMNARCYEAPACGALLFVEEENLEIKDFLEDKKECVYYNEKNLEYLIQYYLENNEERNKIANAGEKKIQNYQVHQQYNKLYIRIKELFETKKIKKNKSFIKLSKTEQNRAIIKNINDVGLKLFPKLTFMEKILKKQIADSNNKDAEALNNLAVINVNLLSNMKIKELEDNSKQKAIEYLKKAIKEKNDYIIAHFNLAYLYLDLEKEEEALNIFLKSTKFLNEDYKKALSIPGLFLKKKYWSNEYNWEFKIQWEKGFCDKLPKNKKVLEEHKNILLAYIWNEIGNIHTKKHDKKNAIKSYKTSLNMKPDITNSAFKLAQLFENLDAKDSIKYYKQAIKNKPLDLKISVKYTKLLYKIDEVEECEKVCKENMLIIKTCDYLLEYRKDFNSLMEKCTKKFFEKGIEKLKNKDYKKANYYFKKGKQEDSLNLFHLAISYLRLKKDKKAVDILEKLIQKNFDLKTIWNEVSKVFYDRREIKISNKIYSLIKNNKILWKIQNFKESVPYGNNILNINKHQENPDYIILENKEDNFEFRNKNLEANITINRKLLSPKYIFRAYSKSDIDNLNFEPYKIFSVSNEIINYAIEKGISTDKLHKIPICIDTNTFSDMILPLEIEETNKFNFLTICHWNKSKNKIIKLIKNYVENFSQEDQVCLLIKIFDDENENELINNINNKIENLGETPDIVIINEKINTTTFPSIMATCNTYINLENDPFKSLVASAMKKNVISFEELDNNTFTNKNQNKLESSYLYIKENHNKKIIGQKIIKSLVEKEFLKILKKTY